MFLPIDNVPRDYAWGSRSDIAELRGVEPSGAPEAELWLGAHPGSPARILDPAAAGGARDLAEWIDSNPADAGLAGPRLPFLLKLLAAAEPLSLQAHPSLEQAGAGFARENAEGVPLEAAHRNYKDAFHKPELVVALSEEYSALCGFRAVGETRALLSSVDDGSAPLAALAASLGDATSPDADVLRTTVDALLRGRLDGVVEALVDACRSALATGAARDAAPVLRTITELSDSYPGDPGVAVAFLLNRVTLTKGEALWLPAGNIHAYLHGFGVELMASSDNVLRGGLTPKHVDVDELLDVLDFEPLPVPILRPIDGGAGVEVFRPDVPDFELLRVDPSAASSTPIVLPGPAIAIVTSGAATLEASTRIDLATGDATYIVPEGQPIRVSGSGELFIATTYLDR
ncbi:mannose-6-phosphate isomerase type 1 [Labedella gwakjiensis]|uniref:mannose-6-phosphate isomerase n=1 Tax=Labedella gwakjiensis TaxID=390269 RepID=A0A2P8GXW4_9MICO|nr:mannose-6-phosphate isomerase, class I [Labedella gwakjiensis]PSL38801.1 mannose-6-phosphate isomerase type 1 [Labedella gwakjiensis]RUQ86727.1 mannose-6-phosphate isomerase, class I [Labedella gwakjiensis]